MKLYFNKFTRATRVRWLVEELGVPCEVVTVDMRAGEHKRPEYLAVHPLGKLPALVEDDGTALIESTAIVRYPADSFADRCLAPGLADPRRGRYLQWAVYAQVTLESPLATFAAHTSFLPEERRVPALAEEARTQFRTVLPPVEAVLGDGRPWILGESFTAADVLIGSVLAWAARVGLCEGFPAATAYVARVTARPAFAASRRDPA